MVWCPIHHVYLRGKRAKLRHAYPNKDWGGCEWLRKYMLKTKKKEIK